MTCLLVVSKRLDNVRVIRAADPVGRRTTERGKVINPEYNIFRDQPIAGASPLRINTLLYSAVCLISCNACEGRNIRILSVFKGKHDSGIRIMEYSTTVGRHDHFTFLKGGQ